MNASDFFRSLPEWSRYKHLILNNYLHVWATKLGSRSKTLAYVDGFAGEGTYESGEPGSPLIAVRCNNQPSVRTQGAKVVVIACEPHADSAKKLRENLRPWTSDPTNQLAHVIEKPFEAALGYVAELTKGVPTLFFIDPFGNRQLTPAKLAPLLRDANREPTEVLVRVDPYLFSRWAGWLRQRERSDRDRKLAASYRRLFAELDLEATADKLIQANAPESVGVELFDKYLGIFEKRFTYVQLIPIRAQYFGAPKYFLVHGTDHPHGCAKLNDVVSVVEDSLFEESTTRKDRIAGQYGFDLGPNRRQPRSSLVELRMTAHAIIDNIPGADFGTVRAELALAFGPDFREKDHRAALRELIDARAVTRDPIDGPLDDYVTLRPAP